MAIGAKVRTPEQILQAMDKDGVRTDSNLLTQLNAELSVSLAKEADRVSRRNLKVATIACGRRHRTPYLNNPSCGWLSLKTGRERGSKPEPNQALHGTAYRRP